MVVQGAVFWPRMAGDQHLVSCTSEVRNGYQDLDSVPSADMVADDVFGGNTLVSGKAFSHLYQATYASELSIGCGVALRPRGSDFQSHFRQHRFQYERDSRQIGFFCLAVHIYPSPMGQFRPSCQIRRRVNHSKPCQWSETGGAGSELNKWKN